MEEYACTAASNEKPLFLLPFPDERLLRALLWHVNGPPSHHSAYNKQRENVHPEPPSRDPAVLPRDLM
jgi:hypothetical protein